MRSVVDKVLSWYFSRDALPYWCIFIIDSLIVFLSGVFTFWLFNKTNALVHYRFEVIYTMLIYVVFSWVGFKMFSTYSGIVRFSSFIDLMRVAYGGLLSMVLALIYSIILEEYGIKTISILSQTDNRRVLTALLPHRVGLLRKWHTMA